MLHSHHGAHSTQGPELLLGAGFPPADHHYATNASLDTVLRFREAAGFKFPVITNTDAAAQHDIEASCGGEKITGVIDVGRVTTRRQETAVQLIRIENILVQPINTADAPIFRTASTARGEEKQEPLYRTRPGTQNYKR